MIEERPGIEQRGKTTYIAPFASTLVFRCGKSWQSWDHLPDSPPMSLELGDEGLSMLVDVHPDTPRHMRALADQAEEMLCALAVEKAARIGA